jgi:predicted amidohydrolase
MELILCQFDIAWEDRRANHKRVAAMLAADPPSPGSLLALPEMFNSGFSMNVAAVTEGNDHPGRSFLRDLARQWKITIVGGLVEDADDGRGRNVALAVSPEGEMLARYTKIHAFSFAGEDRHYTAGETIATFDWAGFKVAPLICYDLRFPELFRLAVDQGADLVLVIADWPARRAEHWTALLSARAIENQAYIAGVNRCGSDPHETYAGQSRIIDPQGRIIAQADDTEQLVRARPHRELVARWRREFPALKDRRRFLTADH